MAFDRKNRKIKPSLRPLNHDNIMPGDDKMHMFKDEGKIGRARQELGLPENIRAVHSNERNDNDGW
jgi:hypothetical protein